MVSGRLLSEGIFASQWDGSLRRKPRGSSSSGRLVKRRERPLDRGREVEERLLGRRELRAALSLLVCEFGHLACRRRRQRLGRAFLRADGEAP